MWKSRTKALVALVLMAWACGSDGGQGSSDQGGPPTDEGKVSPDTTSFWDVHVNPDPGTPFDPGQTDTAPPQDPGTQDPGTADPGTTDPGTFDPGGTDPGSQDPGTNDPGTNDPGTPDPGNPGCATAADCVGMLPEKPCKVVGCEPATGDCVYLDGPDGEPCGSGNVCESGTCVDPCPGACNLWTAQCAGAGGYKVCSVDPGTNCPDLGYFIACQPGNQCAGGECTGGCVVPEVMLVVDRSSSMLGDLWDLTEEGLTTFVEDFEADVKFGIRVFPAEEGCTPDDPVGLALDNGTAVIGALTEPATASSTPLAAALEGLAVPFGDPNQGEHVVLLTDGSETCGDPDDVSVQAMSLRARGTRVHVVGLGTAFDEPLLKAVSADGDGFFYKANSAGELKAVLDQIAATVTGCAQPGPGITVCRSQACEVLCNAGFHECAGQCKDNDSVQHCGDLCQPCATDPNGETWCDGQDCHIDCNPGHLWCDGVCAACPSDPNGGPVCAGTSCVVQCDPGWAWCNGKCAQDAPDLSFEDTNCDGMDGDEAVGFFVAGGGSDTNPGTREEPVATLDKAIELAQASDRPRKEIYASKHNHVGTVVLASGVSLYGGYDATDGWSRDFTNQIVIQGTTTGVLADGIQAPTTFQLFHIQTSNATGAGNSSYGVRVIDSTGPVRVESCVITAGNGSAGKQTQSQPAQAKSGSDGNNASSASTGAYGGGAPTCVQSEMGGCGGKGGNGGAGSGSSSAMKGKGGASGCAAGGKSGGSGGAGGYGNGYPGSDGKYGSTGAKAGTATSAIGNPSASGLYDPARGDTGNPGQPGSGGGGGGGGGGDNYPGAGGGGGGSGGCGGLGGPGGEGGGGSFGIFVSNSVLESMGNGITTSAGGDGGNGGPGGTGGEAGEGGNGGNHWVSFSGGHAGDGGKGGTGGDGGGGPGGPSIGILSLGSTLTSSGDTFTLGSVGTPGQGQGTAADGLAGVAQDILEI